MLRCHIYALLNGQVWLRVGKWQQFYSQNNSKRFFLSKMSTNLLRRTLAGSSRDKIIVNNSSADHIAPLYIYIIIYVYKNNIHIKYIYIYVYLNEFYNQQPHQQCSLQVTPKRLP